MRAVWAVSCVAGSAAGSWPAVMAARAQRAKDTVAHDRGNRFVNRWLNLSIYEPQGPGSGAGLSSMGLVGLRLPGPPTPTSHLPLWSRPVMPLARVRVRHTHHMLFKPAHLHTCTHIHTSKNH